jgi:hypothetical protein
MVSHPLRRPDRLDKINGEFVDRMGHPTTTLGSSSHRARDLAERERATNSNIFYFPKMTRTEVCYTESI